MNIKSKLASLLTFFNFPFIKHFFTDRLGRGPATRDPAHPAAITRRVLPRYERQLRETLESLETAWEQGGHVLERALTRRKVASILGKHVIQSYRFLVESGQNPSSFRKYNVGLLLDALQTTLARPQKWFPAGGQLKPNRSGETQIKKVWVTHGGKDVELRFDQVLKAHFWGIGFVFDRPRIDHLLVNQLVRQSVRGLAYDLRGLQHIQSLAELKRDDVRIVPEQNGYFFEQLMMDILNEHRVTTRRAPLLEDFFEKTDLRYKTRGLSRRRGARVQVTYTIQPEFHAEKVSKIRHHEELIILSPLSLAKALRNQREELSSRLDVGAIWDCVGKLATIHELADSIRGLLFKALDHKHDDPRGPLGSVPQPIRNLIQVYVELEAFRSTQALRTREKKYGPARTINYARRLKRKRMQRSRKKIATRP